MESFVEKMARKALEEPKFQQSWRVHMAAFGPVLEGCFREDDQARIHLCAALNHISRRECARGMGKLQLVEPRCRTEADRAAVAFFRGVCHQMAGDEGRMAICYREAIDRGLKFYMPYMKLAKLYKQDNDLDKFCSVIELLLKFYPHPDIEHQYSVLPHERTVQ